jgi:magnesium-transporting ATPase (P-type)
MNKLPAPRPDRISYKKHQQDVTRQIILPVAFVVVMILVLAILTGVATFMQAGDVGRWASIAIIWMVIPLMGLLLVILAVTVGLAYLMVRVLQVSPRYTNIVQAYALLINAQIILWTDRLMQPILKTQAWLSLFSKEEK